jgi:hypothetical protein
VVPTHLEKRRDLRGDELVEVAEFVDWTILHFLFK